MILGPTHKSFIKKFLNEDDVNLPEGYDGAPFLCSIIEKLLDNGYQVTALTTSVCTDKDYTVKVFQNKNFTWVVVPSRKHSFRMNGGKLGRMVDFFKLEREMMVDVINKTNPDVVHAHWSYEFAAAAIKSKFPYLVTVHDLHWKVLQFMPNPYRFMRALMAEYNLRKIGMATTVSPYTAKCLANLRDIVIVPNPIKIINSRFVIERIIEQRLATLVNPQIIMVNNGWSALKNGIFGLQVLKALLAKGIKAELHLIGHGCGQNSDAFNDAKRLAINTSVHFHGRISNDRLIEMLKDIHFMLHTSKEETFGVVLGEAASMGVPALGYAKAGAVPWVIGDDSLLYKKWDAEAVSNQLSLLVSDVHAYRVKCTQVYDRVANMFSVNKVVRMYEEQYKKAVECFS